MFGKRLGGEGESWREKRGTGGGGWSTPQPDTDGGVVADRGPRQVGSNGGGWSGGRVLPTFPANRSHVWQPWSTGRWAEGVSAGRGGAGKRGRKPRYWRKAFVALLCSVGRGRPLDGRGAGPCRMHPPPVRDNGGRQIPPTTADAAPHQTPGGEAMATTLAGRPPRPRVAGASPTFGAQHRGGHLFKMGTSIVAVCGARGGPFHLLTSTTKRGPVCVGDLQEPRSSVSSACLTRDDMIRTADNTGYIYFFKYRRGSHQGKSHRGRLTISGELRRPSSSQPLRPQDSQHARMHCAGMHPLPSPGCRSVVGRQSGQPSTLSYSHSQGPHHLSPPFFFVHRWSNLRVHCPPSLTLSFSPCNHHALSPSAAAVPASFYFWFRLFWRWRGWRTRESLKG